MVEHLAEFKPVVQALKQSVLGGHPSVEQIRSALGEAAADLEKSAPAKKKSKAAKKKAKAAQKAEKAANSTVAHPESAADSGASANHPAGEQGIIMGSERSQTWWSRIRLHRV